MTKDEALKMAIEFIDNVHEGEWLYVGFDREDVINACKEALEQPAQEPYCWCFLDMLVGEEEAKSYEQNEDFKGAKAFPLYTHPHQWQGLTDDEIWELKGFYDYMTPEEYIAAIRGVEAKLKDKNHG
jgi:hypothetical protein